MGSEEWKGSLGDNPCTRHDKGSQEVVIIRGDHICDHRKIYLSGEQRTGEKGQNEGVVG